MTTEIHTPAIFDDLPAAEYHATDALSSSGIKELVIHTPAHYMQQKQTPRKATAQMEFGTVLHTLVLEPHLAEETYIVLPDETPDKRTKEGKVWWPEFYKNAAGRIILTPDDLRRAMMAAAAIHAHPVSGQFLNTSGRVEASLFWDEREGVVGRARPDFLTESCEVMVDLKTAVDASKEAFMRSVWAYRYDIQMAWYLRGVTEVCNVMPRHALWCVVEPVAPFAVAWYRAERDVIQIGELDITRAVEVYSDCRSTGQWPGYPQEIQPLHLPKWARSRDAADFS